MKKGLITLWLVLGIMCVGCADKPVLDDSHIQIEDVSGESSNESLNEEITNDESKQEVLESEEPDKEEFDLFAEMKNREFYFSSGAGGWRTIMHIAEDGSFSGEYTDSDMGSTGDGYPNGTYYVCSFKGEFTQPVKVNDNTYSVGIAGIEYANEPGTEEIIDGMLYSYSEPYGIAGTNSLLFYLPGTPLHELPEEYLDWVRYEVSEAKDDKLSFYGIYNEKEKNGFSSYEILNVIDEIMRQTKETSAALKASLENDPLTQTEMNLKSQELYQVWDDTLNKLWTEAKNTMSKDKFESVLNEQRQWIKDKEKAVEEAGTEMAGGSMESLLRNLKAAEMTEKRVYELYDMLK